MEAIGSSLLCFVGATLLVSIIILASAIRVVPEYKRLRVYRLGRDIGEKGPGLVLLIPIIDRAMDIDINSLPINNMNTLVGVVGEAQTSVHTNGSVVVGGQTWDAKSDCPIAPKSKIRVKHVVLEVEEVRDI